MARAREKRLTLDEMIEKRKRRWDERKDLEFDTQLVQAAAEKVLSDERLAREARDKPYKLVELCFHIVDKKRATVPFFLNEVQQDFIGKLEQNGRDKPFFVLKGRQQGFTSLITAVQLANAIVRPNFAGFTMADRSDNTEAIFNDKCRTVYERLPEILKPHEKFNSVHEMVFDRLNSSWRIATATNQVGRSRTLNFVHLSEVAFYTCSLADIQAGLGEAIVPGATVIYESTANGYNKAKDLWDSGACVNLFYPWWRTAEYRTDDDRYIGEADAWLRERIAMLERIGLEREQIAWYCRKYAGYLDKSLIRQEYPCNQDEAFVASSDSMFDAEAIANRLTIAERIEPERGAFEYRKACKNILARHFENTYRQEDSKVGEEWTLEDRKWIPKQNGMIAIYEQPKVKTDRDKDPSPEAKKNAIITHRCPYVIGGDTAGSGEDYFTAKVVNCLTGLTAATLRVQRIDEDLYAEQVICLAEYYNHAMIAIETNYSRVPENVIVDKYRYDNIYMRERFDKLTSTRERVPGFETTRTTKPYIIGRLVAFMREYPDAESDPETLREMLTFVHKDNGKMEALDGCHDDLVMALAIAHQARGQQATDWIIERPRSNPIDNWIGVSDGDDGQDAYQYWEDF